MNENVRAAVTHGSTGSGGTDGSAGPSAGGGGYPSPNSVERARWR